MYLLDYDIMWAERDLYSGKLESNRQLKYEKKITIDVSTGIIYITYLINVIKNI